MQNIKINRNKLRNIICLATIAVLLAMSNGAVLAQNIALHKKVTVAPNPNNSAGANNDPQQLTDGIYASTGGAWNIKDQKLPLWKQSGTLGWRTKRNIAITIDLGSVQPISGVIFSTGAGGKTDRGWGVTWPDAIYVAVSNDKETWHYAGDLVQLVKENEKLPSLSKKGTAFRYISHNLQTHGRYVSLGVVGYPYVFADEIEVLRGDNSLLDRPAGKKIAPMEKFMLQHQITTKAKKRQIDDIDSIRDLLKKVDIPTDKKNTFKMRLAKDAAATKDMALQSVDFKTIIPISQTHRDILSIHGEALQAQGFKPLTVWKKQRYAWLPLVNVPDSKLSVSLDFSMLKNEFRSDAVLLTNASSKPITVKVQLEDTPSNAQSGWLQLSHAIWSDTLNNNPVQSALMPLKTESNSYWFKIPAGITGKLWVTINSSKIPSGTFKSSFTINSGKENMQVPIDINVSKITMDKPRLSLTMWDYTFDKGRRGRAINKHNYLSAIKLMQSHFVDTPVRIGGIGIDTSTLSKSDFNEDGTLKDNVTLDFSSFDQWVEHWPNARYYLIYSLGLPGRVAGKIGSAMYEKRFGNYIKAIAEHAQEKFDIKPSQLLLIFWDEPNNDKADQVIIDKAKAVKSIIPEVTVFSNPRWKNPEKAKNQKAFTLPDILCIVGDHDPDFYEKLRQDKGKKLWFYTTPPGVHNKSPQAFYRAYAWKAYKLHARGIGWWSFGDTRTKTSWNAYNSRYGGYSPVFIDKNNIYNSVHWNAVREGIEDNELLSMLSDAIAKSANKQQKQHAQKVLNEAVATTVKAYSKGRWSAQTDPFIVDRQITKVRQMLNKMN